VLLDQALLTRIFVPLNFKKQIMTRIWLYLFGSLILFSACVPNKKLVYLQKDDLKHRERIPKDTILRSHTLNIKEYRIQPLDLLSISFETLSDETDAFNFLPKLSPQSRTTSSSASAAVNGLMVNAEGEIEYPVLGKIKVAGLSIFEAKALIQSMASKYFPEVIVRVRMLNFRYTVLGEVNGEKTVVSPNIRLTLMEAIGQAGGLGELADRSHVKVIRQNGNQAEIFYVDLLKEDFLESPYYYVQQNDVIIVPPLKQRPFRKYFVGNLGIITSAISFGLLIITLSNR
jgi:polysaccharide biosynthesis/export protein